MRASSPNWRPITSNDADSFPSPSKSVTNCSFHEYQTPSGGRAVGSDLEPVELEGLNPIGVLRIDVELPAGIRRLVRETLRRLLAGLVHDQDVLGLETETRNAAIVHANVVDTCDQCHAGQIADIPQTVADAHNGATTERGGIIWDGMDTAVEEGKKFTWEITGVVDDGTNLAITWQASYKGVGVDPCNATVGAGAPVFHVGNRMRFYRSYAQGDDFIIGASTSSPGQALNVTVDDTNTVCASNIATTTIPVDSIVAEKGRLALGGKPLVLSEANPALTVAARVPTPTYDWKVGDGAAATVRREIVDTGECLKCHVGSLYQHGGNRVDNVGMCILITRRPTRRTFVLRRWASMFRQTPTMAVQVRPSR